MNNPNTILNTDWDVIVIGTGMGGATVGHSLALKGLKVLFLEKGGEIHDNEGWITETNPDNRLKQGWWPHPVSQQRKNGKFNQFYAAVGCGRGGSSIQYGAALERFERSDFDALDAEYQSLQPWPVSFSTFQPYYEKAEALYGITEKTKASRPMLSDWDQSFMEVMQKNGLKPERLNIAINYDNECTECIGKICPRGCKADAKTICLDEALKQDNCDILDNCEVERLEADQNKVNHVLAKYQGDTIKLNAKQIVLAAGALHSPEVLLKSSNQFWPNGLANSSDQVGRNLMFHISDMYAVWSPKQLSKKSLQNKSISIRDFYVKEGQRLGYIQSLGLDAGAGHIAMFLKDRLRKFGIHHDVLLTLITKIPAMIVAKVLGQARLLAINIEDDPIPTNRITLNPEQPNGTSFSYEIPASITKRADALYKAFSAHIKPWRIARVMPAVDINHGHPCGTCRFGNNPRTSVLNSDCRAHDIDNLYIVDSSFMPRSGAANPSLTIAANALRVAEKIASALT